MSQPGLSPSPWTARREVLRAAWPIILANASTPLLGLADTLVIGHQGSVEELGAIALGALIFNFVYWGFGFLRMGTTGFVAQAAGRRDEPELRASVVRALLVAACVAGCLLVLQRPIASLSLELLQASPTVEATTDAYFRIRIWGAPASLGLFCLMGCLIGLGASRELLLLQLLLQLLLNGSNIALDVLFAGVYDLGAQGVALGTVLATWLSLLWGLRMVAARVRARAPELPLFDGPRVLCMSALRATFAANTDIMLRTILLLAGFAWFTNLGARFGDAVLAANHLLLQLVSFCAFFLDGFAHVAESLVGQAKGTGQQVLFDRAVRRTSELAVATGLALALAALCLTGTLAGLLTDLPAIRTLAEDRNLELSVYIALSPWAFQLDGIFIGTTHTRALRNAAGAALLVFLVLSLPLAGSYGNTGLWWAFVGYVLARGFFLAILLPGLRRTVVQPAAAA